MTMSKEELNKQTGIALEAWLNNEDTELEYLSDDKWSGCSTISHLREYPHRIKPEPELDLDELHHSIMTKWIKLKDKKWTKLYFYDSADSDNDGRRYQLDPADYHNTIEFFKDAEFSGCPKRENK